MLADTAKAALIRWERRAALRLAFPQVVQLDCKAASHELLLLQGFSTHAPVSSQHPHKPRVFPALQVKRLQRAFDSYFAAQELQQELPPGNRVPFGDYAVGGRAMAAFGSCG